MAEFSIRHARMIIACWLALAALSVPYALQLPAVLGDHGLSVNGSYAQVQKRLWHEFRIPDEPVIVLFQRAADQSEAHFQTAIARLLQQAERIAGVETAAAPFGHPDMQRDPYAYALLQLEGNPREQKAAIGQLRGLIAEERNVKAGLTGKPIVQDDVNRSSGHDVRQAEMWGIPAALLLLLLTLGRIRLALIPIVAGGMAVAIAMGVMYVIGVTGLMPLSVFVVHVIPMSGMAVSIDFALLMISRYREERAAHSSVDAACRTMGSAGRAVITSAGCVLLALVGTLWIRMPIFHSVACAAMVAVVVSAMINLTFVPAFLHLFGNRRSLSKLARRVRSATSAAHRRHPLLTIGLRRPVATVFAALYVLLLCLAPVPVMQTAVPGPESLPSGTDSRTIAETFARTFNPLSLTQMDVLVDDPGGLAGRMQRELSRDATVIRMEAIQSPVREGTTLLRLHLYGDASSEHIVQWLRDFEQRYGTSHVMIGGEPKYRQEIADEIFNRIKYVVGFVIASNFLLLAWAFRSILIPLKAILMNFASIGAAFGILTWIFEGGRWGMEPSAIAIMIPVFLFGLVFGISMDYGVFLLSRIRESYLLNRDNDLAIRDGLAGSSLVITAAAAIMIAVTLPFATAGVTGVKQLGIGIAAALFIDVIVMRFLLAPALMKLLGDWNWRLPFVKS